MTASFLLWPVATAASAVSFKIMYQFCTIWLWNQGEDSGQTESGNSVMSSLCGDNLVWDCDMERARKANMLSLYCYEKHSPILQLQLAMERKMYRYLLCLSIFRSAVKSKIRRIVTLVNSGSSRHSICIPIC